MTTLDLPGLESIRSSDVQQYLQRSGWGPLKPPKNDVIYYRTLSAALEPPRVVQVLLDPSFADYRRRMAELVDALAAHEARPVLSVVNDLLYPPADIARLRTASDSLGAGLIPLEESIAIRQAASDMLLASAHSAISPKPSFPRMAYAKALEFLGECREGQTERGSYVTSLVIPISPQIDTGQVTLEDPFPRQVTRTFMAALLEAADIMARGAHEELLKRWSKGLSANFLDALGRMRPPGDRSFLEISLTWSRNRPAPDLPKSQVRLEEGAFPIFTEAARTLREAGPRQGVEIEGFIISTKREEQDTSQPGTVVVAAHVEGRPGPVKVRVELSSLYYSQAVDAHKTASQVRMAGTLVQEGRALRLKEAALLDVMPQEELDGVSVDGQTGDST